MLLSVVERRASSLRSAFVQCKAAAGVVDSSGSIKLVYIARGLYHAVLIELSADGLVLLCSGHWGAVPFADKATEPAGQDFQL